MRIIKIVTNMFYFIFYKKISMQSLILYFKKYFFISNLYLSIYFIDISVSLIRFAY